MYGTESSLNVLSGTEGSIVGWWHVDSSIICVIRFISLSGDNVMGYQNETCITVAYHHFERLIWRCRSRMQNSSHAVPNRWTKNCIGEVKNIVIVGATHGNELHGIYIVNETNSPERKNTIATDFPTLSVSGMIGNIAAVAAIGTGAGRRYCDVDLNRCFTLADLANMDSCTVEELRAKQLNALLGPKSSDTPKTDLILDIHSTTSNTGILLLCHPQDLFALQLVTHLQQKHPEISVSLWPDSEVPFLPSVARSGITVEIGPIAHSTTNSALYQETKIILNEALQYTNAHNENIVQIPRADRTLFQKSVKLQTFTRFASIGFPRDNTGTNVNVF